MTRLLDIKPLCFDDKPESAIFCVLDEPSGWKEGERADGMAFIADSKGILVTAAHVAWFSNKFPGENLHVFCIADAIPIRAVARILECGWRGPNPITDSDLLTLPGRNDTLDERPDVVKEDIALLQLIPESIEIDKSRGGNADTLEVLTSRLRVMPLGVPGYGYMEDIGFDLWCAARNQKAPILVATTGKFRTHERALHSAFQIAAPEVKKGFSGSPVWDKNRRLAVGFVRSGTYRQLPDVARCTDARAIHQYSNLPLSWDTDLSQVVAVAEGLATDSFDDRYEPFTAPPQLFVEPSARPLPNQLDMGLTDRRDDGVPAINFLKGVTSEFQMVCLLGGSGSGKSTLLRRLAVEIISTPMLLRGRYCIPLVFAARDLPDKFNLDDLFRLPRREVGNKQIAEHKLSDALVRNDVGVILFIDGLDEVQKGRAARLIVQCKGLLFGNTPVCGILMASRPNVDLLKSSQGASHSLGFIEILPFDSTQINSYVKQCVSDPEEEQVFHQALRRVEWHRHVTPLQLRMALLVLKKGSSLPTREADLPFEYVRLQLENRVGGEHTPARLNSESRSWSELYRPNAEKVLQALAWISLRHGKQTLEHLEVHLSDLRMTQPFGDLLQRPDECIDYIRRDLIPRTGLVRISSSAVEERLEWEHSTVIDVLAAEARLSMAGSNASEVAALVMRDKDKAFGGDRFMLTQLVAMDRAGWRAQVEQRVRQAVKAPYPDRKEGMFAIRALAAEVEIPPDLRRELVQRLVQIALSPKYDGVSCSQIFGGDGDGLPSAREILQRESLRGDVISVLWMRLRRLDPRRSGKRGPLVVTRAEATLLDLLQLWNEWSDSGLELAHPDSIHQSLARDRHVSGPLDKRSSSTATLPGTIVLDRGGFEIRHKDGSVETFEIPARSFLEGVAKMAQELPKNLPPSHVVALYLRGMREQLNHE